MFIQHIQTVRNRVIDPVIKILRIFFSMIFVGIRTFMVFDIRIAVILCCAMIGSIWTDWNENPMTLNFDETIHRIYKVYCFKALLINF